MMMGLILIGTAILTGRVMRMFRNAAGTIRGVGVGIAVGLATVVIARKAMENDHRLRSRAHKAKRAVTGLMDEVGHVVSAKM